MADLFTQRYNPDVLSCIANLSNDEVFTPPEVANAMLDMLPQELFESPDTKFLDPACKSGVFLREITKRLLKGLEDKIPDKQERIDHILHNQVYGIAITEMTSLLARRSLYCSKYPNCKYSVSLFENVQGNVRYKNTPHRFKDGKCMFCGAKEEMFGDKARKGLEYHAYEFIHTVFPEEIFKMKFDVIISNPPYQLNVGVEKENYAIPIYQKFVEQAKKLNPKYISMIIPSRWFTGGRGLDEFREEMLCDKRICNITDYPNPYDCFQGVDIAGGICYFLWNNSYNGLCEFNSIIGEECHSVTRKLDEYPIFIRDAIGLEIIRKVSKFALKNLSDTVSSQTPYGIITSYKPTEFGTPCWFRQKIGLKYVKSSDVRDLYHNIDKYKVLIPEAPIAGQTDFTKPVGLYYPGNTIIANPGEICSQTLLVANSFNTLEEAESFKSYLHTKTVRFLILQTVVSQHVSREKFCFVPNFDNYNGSYTDKQLCEMWNITEDEWNYIDSRIHNYGADDIDNED